MSISIVASVKAALPCAIATQIPMMQNPQKHWNLKGGAVIVNA